jgi:hypothetical protein
MVALVVALAAGETTFRLFGKPPLYSRFEADVHHGGIEAQRLPDTGFYEQTPLGKRLKVNASGVVRNHFLTGSDIPLRTNELGFRGPPVVFDDRLRTLFLGDSITLGDYLPEERTFVHLVGEMSMGSPTPLQTINAGVGSIGLEEELNILRETGPRVKPDLVVLNIYLNDAQPSPAMHLIPIPRALRWSRMVQHAYQALSLLRFRASGGAEQGRISQRVLESWRRQAARDFPPGPGDWRTDRAAYNRVMLEWFGDWGSAYSDGAQQRILDFARQIFDVTESLGARPLAVIHPTRLQVEAELQTDEPQQVFVAGIHRAGVPVLDLLPALREEYAADPRPLFYDHCHHNIEGAAVVADRIYHFLVESIHRPD